MSVRRLFALPVAAALGIVLLSGCLSEAVTQSVVPAADPHEMAHGGDFSMSATDCEEGGFVAVYPMGQNAKLAGVWELAAIREEVGNPMRSGLGTPLTGPADGNWHMGFRCASATVGDETLNNYIFGWVGDMVKPPAWDPGGADVHFLLAGLGFGNGTIVDALRASTAADITHAYEAYTDWYVPKELPRSAAHAIFSDVEKGIYESFSEMSFYRTVSERTVRLWWQVPADGSESHMGHDHGAAMPKDVKWHPVYWDLRTTGGPQFITPPIDSAEIGCHRGIQDHGPQGGLCQPTLTNVYEHKTIGFTSGPVIEGVTLDKIWTH